MSCEYFPIPAHLPPFRELITDEVPEPLRKVSSESALS